MLINDLYNNKKQNISEGTEGQVVFSGTGANGGTYEIIQSGPTDFMIHANGKHIDTYGSLQRAMSVLKNEVVGLQQGVAEGTLDEAVGMMIKGAAISGANDQDIADRIAAKTGGRVDSGSYGHHVLITYPTTQHRAAAAVKIRKMFPGIELYKSGGNRNAIDEQGMAEGSGPVTHRIGLTVTDPNHPMVSKRGETYQKTVRVTGNDREDAINQAIAHHRRKGYKVHDHHYIGTVDEGIDIDPALAAVAKKYPSAHISKDGKVIQKPVDWPYTPPQQDAEKQQRDLTAKYPNIDDLVAAAERNRDPYYDRAEGSAYYAGREAEQNYQKLKQIQRVIQGLNESLQRTQP